MADWSIDGIRIFVTETSQDNKQIIARLQPLNSDTTYHTFGYESSVIKLGCYIVGIPDATAIRNLTRTGLSYTVQSPYGSLGNWFVNTVNFRILPTVCQTLRTDLASDTIVYQIQMELYSDE